MNLIKKRFFVAHCILWCGVIPASAGQGGSSPQWRLANTAELEAALPARALVEKEHIETEMRTATGIIDQHRRVVAAVVLITAGYAADGRYSHFLLVQAPVIIDGHLRLEPGSYVVGWSRIEKGLSVRVFESATGAERGSGIAQPAAGNERVESFRIWPPKDHKGIQIGRFFLPYSVE